MATALQSAQFALCSEISIGEDGSLPEWIQVFSAGPVIKGKDGRSYLFDPYPVYQAFIEGGLNVPVDINHSTQLKAPKGEEAPAVAFLPRLEVRKGGSVWGRADWTAFGKAQLAEGKLRYVSPAFEYDTRTASAKTGILGTIKRLTSVGLVNTPNFPLAALNAEEQNEDHTMDEKTLIALGLTKNSTPEEIQARIAVLSAAAKPVDKKDEGLTLEKIGALIESKIKGALDAFKPATAAASQEDEHKANVETAINSYATGDKPKIAPHQKDFYIAQCTDVDKLKAVKEHLDAAPVLVSTNSQGPEGTPGAGSHGLSVAEIKMANEMGVKLEDFAKSKTDLYGDHIDPTESK